MSRLYEAIEKARREGHVQSTPTPAGERPVPVREVSGLVFVEASSATPRLDRTLAEFLSEEEPWVEQLRTLATRLHAMEGSERVRRIGVMSAVGGEGKTTIAAALAFVLAEDTNDRVLLLDADIRNREIELALGLPSALGLTDWLKQPTPDVMVRRISPDGPFVLNAGRPFSRPWELISSPHLATLLDAAGQQFRYVVTDCPAEGPVADASRIQEHLDGLLLVVRARTAPRDAIRATVERLKEEKILGIIFNGEVRAREHFKHYKYARYKKRYRQDKSAKRRGQD